METHRDDTDFLKHDEEMRQAYYILLALCREYSIEMSENKDLKNEYLQKIRQIKNDMKCLEKSELIYKVNSLYLPLLKQMEEKHYPSQK